MLTLFIYLVTAIMVLDCLFLVLLVLVQLPKKEAGMGQAFGGAATDALFGAGSGNVLTKVTKWCATIFLVLAIALTIMGNYKETGGSGGAARLQKALSETKSGTPAAPTVPTAPEVPAVSATNATTTNPIKFDLKLPTNTSPVGGPAK